MTILGYQFDKMKVTPEADAALYNELNNKRNYVVSNYRDGMKLSASGLNVYVDPGAAIICGRYVEITDQESLSAVANTEGYVCLTLDLTEVNTSSGTPGSPDYQVVNKQLRLELLQELTQQDVFSDGQVYTFPLGTYTANGTGVVCSMISESYKSQRYVEKIEVIGDHTTGTGVLFGAGSSVNASNAQEIFEVGVLLSRYNQASGAVAYSVPIKTIDNTNFTYEFPIVGWNGGNEGNVDPTIVIKRIKCNISNNVLTVTGDAYNNGTSSRTAVFRKFWVKRRIEI